MSLEWIDIHAHLDKLEEGPEQALKLASSSGVHRVITIGTEPADHARVIALSQQHPNVFGALGVHPHDAAQWNVPVADAIRIAAKAPASPIVAIGEIGLDFYYDNCDRAVQTRAFIEQMSLAEELDLPVEIHTRDAEPETIQVLERFRARVRGVIHCFTGTQTLADAALACGYNISISGIVTFKNADSLRAVVSSIPLNRLHVETDAPFLAPVPYRGKKNTPAFLPATAQFLADLKGVPLEQFCVQMRLNAHAMFPRLLTAKENPRE